MKSPLSDLVLHITFSKPVFYEVNLVWQCSHLEALLLSLKGGVSIDADSRPPRYVLWCCCVICHKVLTFFQIGCGHTVTYIYFTINWRFFPFQIGLCGVILTFATPLCCAIFEQRASIPVSSCESHIQKAVEAMPEPRPTLLYYNKGL